MGGAMRAYGLGLAAVIAIISIIEYGVPALAAIIFIIGMFLYGVILYHHGRRLWYWSAAKLLGWSDHEKLLRENAWVYRAIAKDQRKAKKGPPPWVTPVLIGGSKVKRRVQ
jgi:hypothetical protein